MGSKSKALTSGTGTPEGWLGERRRSYTQQAMVRGPEGTGVTLGEMVWGAWRNGREHGQPFPCPLRHQGACWAPGTNPLSTSLPPAMQSPNPPLHPHPGPYIYTQRPPPTRWA